MLPLWQKLVQTLQQPDVLLLPMLLLLTVKLTLPISSPQELLYVIQDTMVLEPSLIICGPLVLQESSAIVIELRLQTNVVLVIVNSPSTQAISVLLSLRTLTV